MIETLLNEYDELHRRMAETYGATTGHGGFRGASAVGLHKLRHEILAEMRSKREEIVNLVESK